MKNSRYILSIGLVSLLPVCLMLAKYKLKLHRTSYEFTRNIHKELYGVKRFDLKFNSYYIAGHSGTNLYLGNYTAPDNILRINADLTDTQTNIIHLDDKLSYRGFTKVYVDSPYFYLTNGVERWLFKGRLDTWSADSIPIFIPYFQQAIPIGKNSAVFVYVSTKTESNALRKESVTGSRIERDSILEKQLDGLFCTAGLLQYSKQMNNLTYTYIYRNQILLLDTNMNVLRKIKTIDPIDTVTFETAKIESSNSTAITSPATMVNSKMARWKKYLFILSKLMGRNEDQVLFTRSSVIDIYDLEQSKYLYSVYLPSQDKNTSPVSDLYVMNNYIYTISSHFINRYAVKLPMD